MRIRPSLGMTSKRISAYAKTEKKAMSPGLVVSKGGYESSTTLEACPKVTPSMHQMIFHGDQKRKVLTWKREGPRPSDGKLKGLGIVGAFLPFACRSSSSTCHASSCPQVHRQKSITFLCMEGKWGGERGWIEIGGWGRQLEACLVSTSFFRASAAHPLMLLYMCMFVCNGQSNVQGGRGRIGICPATIQLHR